MKVLSESATVEMPPKGTYPDKGYIHMRPGTLYHELDPMNVVFEVQRRRKWDQMPVRQKLSANRFKAFKWHHVLDYLTLQDENYCLKYAYPYYQTKFAPHSPYDTASKP